MQPVDTARRVEIKRDACTKNWVIWVSSNLIHGVKYAHQGCAGRTCPLFCLLPLVPFPEDAATYLWSITILSTYPMETTRPEETTSPGASQFESGTRSC